MRFEFATNNKTKPSLSASSPSNRATSNSASLALPSPFGCCSRMWVLATSPPPPHPTHTHLVSYAAEQPLLFAFFQANKWKRLLNRVQDTRDEKRRVSHAPRLPQAYLCSSEKCGNKNVWYNNPCSAGFLVLFSYLWEILLRTSIVQLYVAHTDISSNNNLLSLPFEYKLKRSFACCFWCVFCLSKWLSNRVTQDDCVKPKHAR